MSIFEMTISACVPKACRKPHMRANMLGRIPANGAAGAASKSVSPLAPKRLSLSPPFPNGKSRIKRDFVGDVTSGKSYKRRFGIILTIVLCTNNTRPKRPSLRINAVTMESSRSALACFPYRNAPCSFTSKGTPYPLSAVNDLFQETLRFEMINNDSPAHMWRQKFTPQCSSLSSGRTSNPLFNPVYHYACVL